MNNTGNPKKPIRVALVGVGNCAKSLIEGAALYTKTGEKGGLAFEEIGGYQVKHIRFVLGYDVDVRKVGKPLKEAIYAKPNCAMDMQITQSDLSLICDDTLVKQGAVYDGVAEHMQNYPAEESFRLNKTPDATKEDIVNDLKRLEIDVLLNYLPVGAEAATKFYVDCCLAAKVPFVNCIPVFIVSDSHWEKKIKAAGIPAIGDDMRSQLGASVMSQALQELFFSRGLQVRFHKQTNDGGNTDFLNMLDSTRLTSKRISKENVIRSQNDIRDIPVPKNGIYAGPSSYIPFQGDNKTANFRIEATGFGHAPVIFDGRLSVQDSPNSGGVVIDAIRYLQVAREIGLVGALRGPSAATQKTPPNQMMIHEAYEECKALANRELTDSLRRHNLQASMSNENHNKVINTFDLDGVIFQDEYDGIYPGKNDIVITGRSCEEKKETEAMLAEKGIKNRVIFNPLPFSEKTRISSGQHKGNTIKRLQKEGYIINLHFEDDEIQANEISQIAPDVRVILLTNTPVEKENQRHNH